MTLQVLRAESDADRQVWLQAWEQTPAREPFCHPDYCALFAAPGAEPLCMTGHDGGRRVIFPFVLRELCAEPWTSDDTEHRKDITLPVGYGGGYLCDVEQPLTGEGFWRAFDAWARANDVVCGDTRLSLYPDEILPMPSWTRISACDNIAIDLHAYHRRGPAGFASSLRRNVRLAERAGVTPELDCSEEAFTAFRAMYRETMDRRGARPSYYFPDSFFERLAFQISRGFARLFIARDHAGNALCAEVVLLGGKRAYAFLAGSNERGRRAHAHELLRNFACSWLAGSGWDEFVLGGGNSPDDSLFQHKLRFAPDGRRRYHKARKIYDRASYTQLVRRRRSHDASSGSRPPAAPHFPEYR